MAKSVLSLTFLFLNLLQVAFAQEKIDIPKFNEYLNKLNIKFSQPKGYAYQDSHKNYPCGDAKIPNNMMLIINNQSDDIRIGFSVLENSSKIEKTTQKFSPSFDINKNYINTAKSKADTINSKLIFYNKDFTNKTGFDDGGEYSRNCTFPYEHKFPFHRTIFYHKEDVADIEMTIFATTKKKLETEISKLKQTITSK